MNDKKRDRIAVKARIFAILRDNFDAFRPIFDYNRKLSESLIVAEEKIDMLSPMFLLFAALLT